MVRHMIIQEPLVQMLPLHGLEVILKNVWNKLLLRNGLQTSRMVWNRGLNIVGQVILN